MIWVCLWVTIKYGPKAGKYIWRLAKQFYDVKMPWPITTREVSIAIATKEWEGRN